MWRAITRLGWRNPWLPVSALAFAWLCVWLFTTTIGIGQHLAVVPALAAAPGPLRWPLFVVLAALSIVCYVAAFTLLRLGLLVRGTPTSQLRSAAQGLVELTGKADGFDDAGLRAPESGMPCVWYSTAVIDSASGIHPTDFGLRAGALAWLALHLRLIPGTTSRDSLVLHSPQGDVVVDPVGAYVLPGRTRFGVGFREDMIQAGQELFVLGSLQTRRHDLASMRQAAIQGRMGELLVAWKRDPDDLRKRFGFDGEHLTGEQWEIVRTAAFEAAVKEAGPPPDPHAADDITHCIAQPKDGQPFLIAAMDEAAVLRRLDIGMGLNFVAGLWSGVALVRVLLAH